jgi:hypothetical protein
VSEKPHVHVVPTFAHRRDPVVAYIIAGFVLGFVVILSNNNMLGIVPFVAIPGLLWFLTSEDAEHIKYGCGMVAVWLRNRLGLRSAHQWCMVIAHYWRLVIWPVWVAAWQRLLRFIRAQITALRLMLSERAVWLRSGASSWVVAAGCQLSANAARFKVIGTGLISRVSNVIGTWLDRRRGSSGGISTG